MVATKSAEASAEKFARNASQAGPDYEAGVRNPKKDWASETMKAKEAYKAGVQDSISRGAYEKGVQEAGSEKWQRKAATVGKDRFASGARAAEGDYKKGVEPYLQEIERVVLPARGRRGDPANYDRSRVIGEALHKKRTGSA